MSLGYLENGKIVIRNRPMKEMGGKKIDYHKRWAVMEMQMFRQLMEVLMSVEVSG